jgi:hypothetical protein
MNMRYDYRRSVFIPTIESVLSDFASRLSMDSVALLEVKKLFPAEIAKSSNEDLSVQTGRLFAEVKVLEHLGFSERQFLYEVELWRARCARAVSVQKDDENRLNEILKTTGTDEFPTVHTLLKIFGTLPTSVATAERSFSTLRRLKTWCRTTMGEDRLTGLALLYVHSDVPIDIEKVIELFASSKSRKLKLLM